MHEFNFLCLLCELLQQLLNFQVFFPLLFTVNSRAWMMLALALHAFLYPRAHSSLVSGAVVFALLCTLALSGVQDAWMEQLLLVTHASRVDDLWAAAVVVVVVCALFIAKKNGEETKVHKQEGLSSCYQEEDALSWGLSSCYQAVETRKSLKSRKRRPDKPEVSRLFHILVRVMRDN